MEKRNPKFLCCVLLLAIVSACGDEDAPTVTLTGLIRDALTKQPTADVKVCVHGRADIACATSDNKGNYTLAGVPANERLWIAYSGQDLVSQLSAKETKTSDINWTHNVVNSALFETQATLIGVTIDKNMGHVSGGLFNTKEVIDNKGVPGLTATITPKAGKGPFYTSASGLPDAKLSATTTSGAFVVVNVPPGEYVLTFKGKDCEPYFGWMANGVSNTAEMKVVAGHASWVNYVCK